MKWWISFFIWCFFQSCFGNSQSELIPRKVLFANSDKSAVSISPDGKKIAYLSSAHGTLNIWVQTIGNQDDHSVTCVKDQTIDDYWWSADSNYLIFDCDDSGSENTSLFAVELSSKSCARLINSKGARERMVKISERFPSEIVIATNARNPKFFDLYRVNLITKNNSLCMKMPRATQSLW